MQTLVIVFLAVIAVSALLQAAAAIGAAIAARKLEQRVDEIESRFERELRPALANVARIVQTAADVSDQAAAQARRVDTAVAEAAERVNAAVDPWTASRAASRRPWSAPSKRWRTGSAAASARRAVRSRGRPRSWKASAAA
jgi:hypothetical protein